MNDFSQAARIGPDGVVLGPDKASTEVNRAADQALGNFGIKNLKISPDGIQVNDGNRLNSSVTVSAFLGAALPLDHQQDATSLVLHGQLPPLRATNGLPCVDPLCME